MSNGSKNPDDSEIGQNLSVTTGHSPDRRRHKLKETLMLNSYLYAAPNVIERLTQGERRTGPEYKSRAKVSLELFDKAFGELEQ